MSIDELRVSPHLYFFQNNVTSILKVINVEIEEALSIIKNLI